MHFNKWILQKRIQLILYFYMLRFFKELLNFTNYKVVRTQLEIFAITLEWIFKLIHSAKVQKFLFKFDNFIAKNL